MALRKGARVQIPAGTPLLGTAVVISGMVLRNTAAICVEADSAGTVLATRAAGRRVRGEAGSERPAYVVIRLDDGRDVVIRKVDLP